MTVEEMLTAKEGENFEFKTAEVFVGTVLADLADISDLGEIFICFDDLRLPWGQSPQVSQRFPWGQSPQVSQCAARMAGLPGGGRGGGVVLAAAARRDASPHHAVTRDA